MTKPLPSTLLDRLSSFLSEPDFRAVLDGFSSGRPASFRVNGLKSNVFEIETALSAKGIRFERFEVIPSAYVVPKDDEYALKGTDAYYGGKIYVQGLSSMLPARFLNLKNGARVLDVCAAPGSKTTQIADLLGGSGEIVALEKHQIRFDKLVHNCRLQGAQAVKPIKIDAIPYLERFSGDGFDAILLDVPCSAEGRIRLSDEKTFGFWTEKNILEKAELQKTLLATAFSALRPGWTLVYSTCTLAPEENEGVISTFLDGHPSATLDPCLFDIPESRPGLPSFQGMKFHPEILKALRILPSKRFEGFFIAVIRKST